MRVAHCFVYKHHATAPENDSRKINTELLDRSFSLHVIFSLNANKCVYKTKATKFTRSFSSFGQRDGTGNKRYHVRRKAWLVLVTNTMLPFQKMIAET